MKIKGLNT